MLNTPAYIIYLLVTYLITVKVGLIFFRSGRLYMLHLLHGDEALTHFINKMLLTGYFLLNLGYATIMIRYWNTINTATELIVSIGTMTGRIMLLLAGMHFFNMATLYYLSKYKTSFHQP
jgi:hypothetical protein